MAEPTIAAGFVRGLLELAVSKGACRETLIECSGIDPAALEDQDNRLPLAQYVALMRAGQELCGDPALALHFGEAFHLGEMSIVGLMGGGVETLADGLAMVNRYARLVVEVDGGASEDRFVLERRAGQLWMIDTRKNPNAFPELTESAFARIACSMRRRLGGTSLLKAVHVTHREPGYRAEYDRIFQAPVVFGSDTNALVIEGTERRRKHKASSRYLAGILRSHAETLLESLESSKTIRGRVESALLPRLHDGDVSIESIAHELGVSRHTLFRRLKDEGVTFRQVLDELRRTMALHYLSGERLTVNETAYRLGFSEPAAFSRAFKRWTGSSPRAVRRGGETRVPAVAHFHSSSPLPGGK